MGVCTGVTSSCANVGVALETRCHLGQTILYDTITKLGWSSNIIHHGIAALIEGVLAKDENWGTEDESRGVPLPITEDDCVVSCFFPIIRTLSGSQGGLQDCFDWEFGNYRNISGSSVGCRP